MAACAALCHSSAPEARLFSERDGSRQPGRPRPPRRRRRRTRRGGGAGETRFEPARGCERRATIDFERRRLCVRGTFGFGGVRGALRPRTSEARRRPGGFAGGGGGDRAESDRKLEAGDEARRYWSTVGSRGLSRLCAALTRAVFAPPPASATPRRRLPFSSQSSSTSELPSEPSARRSDECDECVRRGREAGGVARGALRGDARGDALGDFDRAGPPPRARSRRPRR